jgi:periplasmic divalent cation tolerance protein
MADHPYPDDDARRQPRRELAATLVGGARGVRQRARPVSTYRWKGRVEREAAAARRKTTREKLPAIEERLRALHPCELPEMVVIAADASEACGRWVGKSRCEV